MALIETQTSPSLVSEKKNIDTQKKVLALPELSQHLKHGLVMFTHRVNHFNGKGDTLLTTSGCLHTHACHALPQTCPLITGPRGAEPQQISNLGSFDRIFMFHVLGTGRTVRGTACGHFSVFELSRNISRHSKTTLFLIT